MSTSVLTILFSSCRRLHSALSVSWTAFRVWSLYPRIWWPAMRLSISGTSVLCHHSAAWTCSESPSVYLKSLVKVNSFQLEGIEVDSYSSSTAILLVFLSDEEHQSIQHMHIGLVVHHMGCNLYTQDGILPFVKYRRRPGQGKGETCPQQGCRRDAFICPACC